jgi:RNA polymerase sigma-70 factor (ECF subfamily)
LHKATLYRFVRRYVGDADDAYDVVQDTFISTWLALRRYDAGKPFSVWLRAIALNKCRDHGRRRAVRRRFLKLFASQPPHAHSVLQDREEDLGSLQAKRLRQLDQAVAALPRVYKEPLLLTTVAGLTQQQTAEQLKTSTKAIEMRIRRAKKRLSEALPKSEENELIREG